MGGPEDKSGNLDYNRPDADTYRDLVTLIKAKSPKFAEMIEKQEFAVQQKEESSLEAQISKQDDEIEGDHTYRSEHHGNTQQQKEQTKDTDRKQKTQTKAKLEP